MKIPLNFFVISKPQKNKKNRRAFWSATYSQLVSVPSVLSIRSIGGHWNCSCTSLASEGFILYFSSHLFKASLIVVAFVAILGA